jgi:predicted DCC family thiol-disulfide oxidoreductase YuxK
VTESAAPDPPDPSDVASATVYFDGACPLCAAEIGVYRRAPVAPGRAPRFVDVADPDCALETDLTREAALRRFHVRGPDGRLHSGAAAFVALWRTLPGWRVLARLCDGPLRLRLLEGAYRAFLTVRPILSRLAGLIPRRQAVRT